MSDRFADQERQICEQFANAAHGPNRNGLFALWLILRVAGDGLPPHPVSERAHKRRSEALVKRLTSLTLPAPLRHPMDEAAVALSNRDAANVAQVLGRLIPPVRGSLGSQAAVPVTAAAKIASRL